MGSEVGIYSPVDIVTRAVPDVCFLPSQLMETGLQSPSAAHTELLSPLLLRKPSSHTKVATLLYVVPVVDSRTASFAEAGGPQSTTEGPAGVGGGGSNVAPAGLPSGCCTCTGGSVSPWVEGFFPVLDSISQLAAALEATGKVCALSSVSTHTCDPALVHVCTGKVTQRNPDFEPPVWSRRSWNSPRQWVPSLGVKTAMSLDGV